MSFLLSESDGTWRALVDSGFVSFLNGVEVDVNGKVAAKQAQGSELQHPISRTWEAGPQRENQAQKKVRAILAPSLAKYC